MNVMRDPVEFDLMGDSHVGTSVDTPLRPDAFLLSDNEKIEIIAEHFEQIMHTLGLDLNDDSLSGTPYRVAKMYVKEIFSGLNPQNEPKISVFDNTYGYKHMLVEKNITLHSNCEHHFVPILGMAHIAYFPKDKVVGLSKINRVVQYFAQRPQVQERLTMQIADYLKRILETDDVAVMLDAKHLCVSTRGIKDDASATVTAVYSGKFKNEATQREFLDYVRS
jgi:GTP cyclohydrolase I